MVLLLIFAVFFSVFPGRQNNAETRDCYVPHKMKYLVKIAEIMKFAFKGSKKNNHSIGATISIISLFSSFELEFNRFIKPC